MIYKKIIYFLLLSLLIPQISLAQDGKIIIDIKEDKEAEMIDYIGLYKEFMQELDYFDKKYPDNQINKDFGEELFGFHPDYSDSWINRKQNMLRIGIKFKRTYDYLKNKIQEIILENDIPLEYDDDEYEFGKNEEYQESEDPLVIVDIKKVVAYSKSPKDKAAIREKIAKDLGLESPYDKRQEMKKALLNRDWKKLLSHGLFDGKNLEDNRGIGKWVTSENISAKLLSIKKYITDTGKIDGVIRLDIPKDVIVLRRDFLDGKEIDVDFSKSDNVNNIKINWPVPLRVFFNHDISAVGYIHKIDIPFEFTPVDHLKNVTLNADIKLSTCSKGLCKKHELSPILDLKPIDPKNDKFPLSMADTSIKLAHHYAPQQRHEDLSIETLLIEKTEEGKQLLVTCTYKNDIDFFDIYIEGKGKEEFYPPLIIINNNTVEARFIPISTNIDIENRDYSIVASTKENISVRKKLKPQNSLIIKDSHIIKLIKTSISAFFIGIFLNFIPIILLIWLLNINLYCGFGGTRANNVKQIALYNMLGIIMGGLILITYLCLYKILGNQILIGMQNQNLALILFAIFVLILAILYLKKVILVPQSYSKYVSFVGGLFVVLIQIFMPITYNTDILGFALLANNWKMILVLTSLFVGVCTPFLLFYFMPEIAYPLGHMYKFLKRINIFIYIVLWTSLLGMIFILCTQTSWHIIWHLVIILSLVSIILFLREQVLLSIEAQKLKNEEYKKAKFKLNIIAYCLILMLLATLFANALYLSKKNHNKESYTGPYDAKISSILEKKQNALLKVSADWCLLCKYNQHTIFDNDAIKNKIANANIEIVDIDADINRKETLELLSKYGKYSIPLYVLYLPNMPNGLVLPSNIDENALENLFNYLH